MYIGRNGFLHFVLWTKRVFSFNSNYGAYRPEDFLAFLISHSPVKVAEVSKGLCSSISLLNVFKKEHEKSECRTKKEIRIQQGQQQGEDKGKEKEQQRQKQGHITDKRNYWNKDHMKINILQLSVSTTFLFGQRLGKGFTSSSSSLAFTASSSVVSMSWLRSLSRLRANFSTSRSTAC